MKTSQLLLTGILICVINFNGFSQDTLTDQKIKHKMVDKVKYPPGLDAVIAAPNNHKILLENDKVRVLDVIVRPGEVEPLHHHRWPSVLHVTQAEEFLNYDAEGNLIFDSRTLKRPIQTPYTMFKEGEAAHAVTNLSKTKPMRLLRVELKEDSNDNLSIIGGLYEAFGKGDIPKILSAMDSEIEWNEAESNSLADNNPYIGPEAILNGVFARIGKKYKTFTLKDIQLHEMSNSQVLATLHYNIIAKNGKAYLVQAAHHWTLKDGMIIKFQQYADTKKLAESEEE